MKRIIKIKEHVLKWIFILLGIAPIFMNIKTYENIGVRSNFAIRYITYMYVLELITSFIEGKIVEKRVAHLGLTHIKPYEKLLLIKYSILFSACIVISWSINIGLIIEIGLLMIILYISTKIKMYIGYKVMYGENDLLVRNKLYDIEEISSVKDNFGSNFHMKAGNKEYEIFCGQLSTKKELMRVLGDKIGSK